LEAQIEAIEEEDSRIRVKQFDIFAKSYGLNLEEVDALKEAVGVLEEKYGHEQALEKGLLIVNRDKAEAGRIIDLPKGGELSAPPKSNKVEVTPEIVAYTKAVYGNSRSPEEVAKGFEEIEGRITEENGIVSFRLSTD